MTFLEYASGFIEKVWRLPYQDDVEWECYLNNFKIDSPYLTDDRIAELMIEAFNEDETTPEEFTEIWRLNVKQGRIEAGLIFE